MSRQANYKPLGHRWKRWYSTLPVFVPEDHRRSGTRAYFCYVRDEMLLTLRWDGVVSVYYAGNKIGDSSIVKSERGMKAHATYAVRAWLTIIDHEQKLEPAPKVVLKTPEPTVTEPNGVMQRLSIEVFGTSTEVDSVYDSIKDALANRRASSITVFVERGEHYVTT